MVYFSHREHVAHSGQWHPNAQHKQFIMVPTSSVSGPAAYSQQPIVPQQYTPALPSQQHWLSSVPQPHRPFVDCQSGQSATLDTLQNLAAFQSHQLTHTQAQQTGSAHVLHYPAPLNWSDNRSINHTFSAQVQGPIAQHHPQQQRNTSQQPDCGSIPNMSYTVPPCHTYGLPLNTIMEESGYVWDPSLFQLKYGQQRLASQHLHLLIL